MLDRRPLVSISGEVAQPAALPGAELESLVDARYVTIGAGEYTVVLTRQRAEDERVLLALERQGPPSPRPAGTPRLVGPSEWDCFQSVKSVDRIELTRRPAQATAATIALARLGAER